MAPGCRRRRARHIVRPLAAVHTERDEQARNEVSGAALNVDLARGEPIRRSLIVKPGDRDFLQVVLTSGARATPPRAASRARQASASRLTPWTAAAAGSG